jgi:hypothetical protein
MDDCSNVAIPMEPSGDQFNRTLAKTVEAVKVGGRAVAGKGGVTSIEQCRLEVPPPCCWLPRKRDRSLAQPLDLPTLRPSADA